MGLESFKELKADFTENAILPVHIEQSVDDMCPKLSVFLFSQVRLVPL